MGAWEVVGDVLGAVAAGLLMIALGWAASERGRVHHHLAGLRAVSGSEPGSRTDRFSVLTER